MALEASLFSNEDKSAERLNLVRVAVNIQAATSAEQISKILALEPQAQLIALEELMQKVAEAASALTLTHSRFFEPLGETLNTDTYVLPPELAEMHVKIVQHLRSGKTNEHLSHSGVLLSGIQGTGKTEYVRFLGGETADDTICVTANINQIRTHADPGDALFQLYRGLDALAQKTGKYIVLLLDECDRLLNPNSHISTSESSKSEEREKISVSEETKSKSIIIDPVGQALLETLKTTLSGTGAIKRVFTIATTNLPDAPAALLRGGRLEQLTLHPFHMGFDNRRNISHYLEYRQMLIANYESYAQSLPRLVAILRATDRRLRGEDNPVLQSLLSEFQTYFSGDDFKSISNDLSKTREEEDRYMSQGKILWEVFQILRVDCEGMSGRAWDFSVSFRKGDGDQKEILHHANSHTPEMERMKKITSGNIATWYKLHQTSFETDDSARKTVAELIFPQVQDWQYRTYVHRQDFSPELSIRSKND